MLETIAALTSAIGGAVGFAKNATDIATDIQALVDGLNDDSAAMRDLVTQLQQRLINLQSAHIAMQQLVLKATDEQKRRERFEAQALRYALHRAALGALVYELKPDQADLEPPHCICATCYEKQIKSILQPVRRNWLGCGVCRGEFQAPDGRGFGGATDGLRTGYDITDPYWG